MKPGKYKPKSQSPIVIAAWIGAVGVIISAVALVVSAVINSQSPIQITQFIIGITQTAEAKQTFIASGFTSTPRSTTNFGPTSTHTATPTITVTPSPSNTPTRTSTPTPIPCPFQGNTDLETLVNLINTEAEAANTKYISLIQSIFAPNALIRDRQFDPGVSPPVTTPLPQKIWNSPDERYTASKGLFNTTSYRSATHTDPMVVGSGITATQAWLVTGSTGEYQDGNIWKPYDNPSKLKSAYGSDHWTFGKNSAGCWVIVRYDFDASHIPFPP